MTTPQTLRDLRERLEHPTTESINGVSRFAVLGLLDRLEVAEQALRSVVQSWDAGDLDTNYDRIASAFDTARSLLSQPHSAEPEGVAE